MDTTAQSTGNGSSPLLNKLKASFLTTSSQAKKANGVQTDRTTQPNQAQSNASQANQKQALRVSTADQLQVLESVLNSVVPADSSFSSETQQPAPEQATAVQSQNQPAQQQVQTQQSQQPQQPVVPLAGQSQQQPVSQNMGMDQQFQAHQQSQNQAQPGPELQQQQQPQPQQPVQEVQATALAQQLNVSQSATQTSPQAPHQQQFPVSPQQPIAARQQNVGMVAQATPTAVDQAMYQQQVQMAQASGGSTAKETVSAGPAVEAGATLQYVENEPNPEISPEVSEYLQHAEDHHKGEPHEVVVGEAQQDVPLATNMPKKSVVVLPITEEVDKKGGRKGPLHSVRWLVEWSRKLIKKFSGEIIYRQRETTN